MKRQLTKIFINLIKLSTMRTLKLVVMAIMTLVVGCQKFEQNNTDNPKDRTEQQGSNKDTNKNDKDNKPDDQQRVKPNPTPSFATGVVRLSPEEYQKVPLAKFPATGDNELPNEFSLNYPKENIPNQKEMGSCVAFSLASSLYHQLMHEKLHVSYSDRSMYPSPAFIYNQAKYSDCETGTIVVKAIELLEDKGVCYEKDMPYDPTDCWRQPTKEQLEKAKDFRIKGFSRVDLTPTAFARALTLGYPIIVTAEVSEGFREAFFKGEIWRPSESGPKGKSYHCFNIIGYQKDASTGKFILQGYNSWGDGAAQGRLLLSEDLLRRNYIVEAYILTLFDDYPLGEKTKPKKEALTVSSSSLDFGEIYRNTLVEKQLTLTANQDVIIKSIIMDDALNYDVQSYEFSLTQGASKNLIIRCKAKELGKLNTRLTITYQVKGEIRDLVMAVNAVSIEKETPPEHIQVDKEELRFYNVSVGEEDRNTINLTLLSGEDTSVSVQLSGDISHFQTLSKVYLYKNNRQTASIGVTYRPRSAGTHRAQLLLTSPNGFNKEVSLLGQAKQPEPEHDDIEIDTPNIDFGTIQLQQGSSVTKLKSFRVTNNNQADVTLTLSSNTDAYTVSPEKVTISPRNTQTITVRLNVRGEGYYPGSIRVQSTRGYEERIQLSGQVVEQQRNDDRGDDRDRDNDRGDNRRDDNHRDHNDQDRRQEQARYRVEVVPVSTIRSGECSGLDKVTFTGKITGENSTVQQAANGDLIINIRIRKTDGGVYIRSGRFFIKYNSFCNLAIDRKGVAYEAGIYEITTSLRMSSDIVGRVIYLQTNADKLPNGEDGERNYCAIKVLKN